MSKRVKLLSTAMTAAILTIGTELTRGELVDTAAMVDALNSGKVGGYGTDVLDQEPPPPNHPLLHTPNTIVTPHIGSRTLESVQRQAMAAVTNLIRAMHGETPLAQVNPEVSVQKVV